MSNPGDVVWADGVAWQRDTDKNWYSTDRYEPLFKKDLKTFPDFTWLVKNGEVKWMTSVPLPSVAPDPEILIEAVVDAPTPVGSHQLENSDEVLCNVHDPKLCVGEPCVVHNLTDHPMRSWPQHWREDSGLMERTCTHGVGHPDPDLPDHADKVHGCDGCCVESTAPTSGGYSPPYEAYLFQISNLTELLTKSEKEREYYSKTASELAKDRFDLEARLQEVTEDRAKALDDRNLVLNELAGMTKQRDAAREDLLAEVATRQGLVAEAAADFPRRIAEGIELRKLRQNYSDVQEENAKLCEELADTTRSLDYTRNELDALAEVNTTNVLVGEEYRDSLETLRKQYYDLQLSHAKDADEARKVHADNDQAFRLLVSQRDKALSDGVRLTAERDTAWRGMEIQKSELSKLCTQNHSQRESIESYQESVKELTAERDKARTKLQNVRNERDILRDQRDAHKGNAVELVEKLHKIGQERPWDLHKGRELERAAIVAWLRSCADGVCVECNGNANDIERGAHLRGDSKHAPGENTRPASDVEYVSESEVRQVARRVASEWKETLDLLAQDEGEQEGEVKR